MAGATYNDLRESCMRRNGSTIDGKYKLLELLGMGATGAVYRALNIWAGREVAVKLFHYTGPTQDAVLQRFLREAQAVNRVRRGDALHPHVVDALDVGRDAATECFFTVQELLKGETLAHFLYRQPGQRVSADAALALLRPIVDAIACAHEAGVIHRDLKPENVFLCDRGPGCAPLPKVLDFGIAQLADARMTPSQALLGTPAYMPPEAFTSASRVDARADVWALGVMLYEMTAGTWPFATGTGSLEPYQAMKAISSVAPPSLAASGTMPHPLWNVVRRCLAKNPALRYPNARALLDALAEAEAPLQTLRVPTGMTPGLLRHLLVNALEMLHSALHPTTRTDGESWVPPENVQRAWWKLVFLRYGGSARDLIEIVGLPELANLLDVQIVQTPLAPDDLAALAQAPAFGSLTGLTLRAVGATAEGVRHVVGSPLANNLVRLEIEDNAVGRDGAAAIAQGPHLASLRQLNLLHADVDDEGARALAASPLLRHLTRLDLSGNRITDEGARALAASPNLGAEIAVILRRNAVSPETAAALAAKLGTRVKRFVV